MSDLLPVAVPGGEGPEPEGVEPDEAGGVLLVICAAVVLEGDEGVGIEGFGALAPGDDGIALVELQANRPSTFPWLSSTSLCSISRSGANQKP